MAIEKFILVIMANYRINIGRKDDTGLGKRGGEINQKGRKIEKGSE
jgi:hypothetical protein